VAGGFVEHSRGQCIFASDLTLLKLNSIFVRRCHYEPSTRANYKPPGASFSCCLSRRDAAPELR
jgi:hypothetical protein